MYGYGYGFGAPPPPIPYSNTPIRQEAPPAYPGQAPAYARAQGYQQGRAHGFAQGHAHGFAQGRGHGLAHGFQAGRAHGYAQGHGHGFQRGHAQGFARGARRGWQAGHSRGFLHGYQHGAGTYGGGGYIPPPIPYSNVPGAAGYGQGPMGQVGQGAGIAAFPQYSLTDYNNPLGAIQCPPTTSCPLPGQADTLRSAASALVSALASGCPDPSTPSPEVSAFQQAWLGANGNASDLGLQGNAPDGIYSQQTASALQAALDALRTDPTSSSRVPVSSFTAPAACGYGFGFDWGPFALGALAGTALGRYVLPSHPAAAAGHPHGMLAGPLPPGWHADPAHPNIVKQGYGFGAGYWGGPWWGFGRATDSHGLAAQRARLWHQAQTGYGFGASVRPPHPAMKAFAMHGGYGYGFGAAASSAQHKNKARQHANAAHGHAAASKSHAAHGNAAAAGHHAASSAHHASAASHHAAASQHAATGNAPAANAHAAAGQQHANAAGQQANAAANAGSGGTLITQKMIRDAMAAEGANATMDTPDQWVISHPNGQAANLIKQSRVQMAGPMGQSTNIRAVLGFGGIFDDAARALGIAALPPPAIPVGQGGWYGSSRRWYPHASWYPPSHYYAPQYWR